MISDSSIISLSGLSEECKKMELILTEDSPVENSVFSRQISPVMLSGLEPEPSTLRLVFKVFILSKPSM